MNVTNFISFPNSSRSELRINMTVVSGYAPASHPLGVTLWGDLPGDSTGVMDLDFMSQIARDIALSELDEFVGTIVAEHDDTECMGDE